MKVVGRGRQRDEQDTVGAVGYRELAEIPLPALRRLDVVDDQVEAGVAEDALGTPQALDGLGPREVRGNDVHRPRPPEAEPPCRGARDVPELLDGMLNPSAGLRVHLRTVVQDPRRRRSTHPSAGCDVVDRCHDTSEGTAST